jgi:hypothetical protein
VVTLEDVFKTKKDGMHVLNHIDLLRLIISAKPEMVRQEMPVKILDLPSSIFFDHS